jgi:ESS family glutamate:Na+ symporter
MEKLTSLGMKSLLFYTAVLGLLLFIGILLRVKVPFFKKYFIPASLIAGLTGLGLGQYGLKFLPADMMTSFATLPGVLITVVFAPMLMGVSFPKPKEVAKIIGPQMVYGYAGDFIQIAVPFLVTALILAPIWKVDSMFGSIVEIGFAGGHGTAGGMADLFTQNGWAAGGPLSLTTATIGLFIGIIGGMIIINYGVRKGYTSIIKSQDELSSNNKQDIIPKDAQNAGSVITINKDVVEPMAFHLSLIAIAILIGWVIVNSLNSVTGLSFPLFPMAMIGGLIVQLIISKTKFADAVDAGSLQRIQGLALELLIVAAIATIKIPVIIEYAMPLLIIVLFSIATMLFYVFYMGPRVFKTQWFEHSIVNFGTLTGVTAVGLMLLRTVDPEMKSDAGRAFALRAPFYSPFVGGGLLTALLPLLAIKYGALIIGLVFLAATVAVIILAKFLGFWNKPVRNTVNTKKSVNSN